MSQCTCAAITLDEAGGGVAAVARLVWHAFHDRWGTDARLVTLQPTGVAALVPPDLSTRVSFGSKLAATQAFGDSTWIFYTHLALARVQRYIPASLRAPYAVFLHGIEVWRPLSGSQRAALEGARLLVANSAYTARRAADMHPWLGPIAVCNLALQTDDLPSADARPQSGRTVLVVGRMAAAEQYKGHDQLIEAWPAVLQTCPDARLLVVGDGDDRARLEAKADRTGSGQAIEFTGFVSAERLESLYRRANVFAMPSRNEGFGLVYLEAMRHGLPCVGSVHDAARELIDDGVTGMLVEQRDIPGLAATIAGLLTDVQRRNAMGHAGRTRWLDRFSRAAFSRRLLSLVDESFGDRGAVAAPDAAGRGVVAR